MRRRAPVETTAERHNQAGAHRQEQEADVSTDYLLRMALARRGLAMHQVALMDYTKHDEWVDIMFESYMGPRSRSTSG